MILLETERLIIRKFKDSDLGDLNEYAKNPNVGPQAGWKPHETNEDSLLILNHFIAEDEVLAIVYKEDNKVIGSVGLHNDEMRSAPGVKMIGFVLSEDYWGKGLMTEAVRRMMQYAFEELGLNLISVDHYSFNHRSESVIKKCGFTYEGTHRFAVQIYDGSIYDIVCYSMTKEEWSKGMLVK